MHTQRCTHTGAHTDAHTDAHRGRDSLQYSVHQAAERINVKSLLASAQTVKFPDSPTPYTQRTHIYTHTV